MNCSTNKLTLWIVIFCLMFAVTCCVDTASATQATAGSSAPAATAKTASGKPSSSDIAAAKASGKVWVNTESGVYHKSGRWYGKTKQGRFMTEAEAKAAGYKAAAKE